MNNLSSCCGLVDAKIGASDKDLPELSLYFAVTNLLFPISESIKPTTSTPPTLPSTFTFGTSQPTFAPAASTGATSAVTFGAASTTVSVLIYFSTVLVFITRLSTVVRFGP